MLRKNIPTLWPKTTDFPLNMGGMQSNTTMSKNINPFPVQFKSLVPGQKSRVFHGTFKFTCYTRNALERLEGEGTFKSRALWSVREGKGFEEAVARVWPQRHKKKNLNIRRHNTSNWNVIASSYIIYNSLPLLTTAKLFNDSD